MIVLIIRCGNYLRGSSYSFQLWLFFKGSCFYDCGFYSNMISSQNLIDYFMTLDLFWGVYNYWRKVLK